MMRKNDFSRVAGEDAEGVASGTVVALPPTQESRTDRVSKLVIKSTAISWLVLPLIYGAILWTSPHARGTAAARAAAAPVASEAPSHAPNSQDSDGPPSRLTCEHLRTEHKGGWLALREQPAVCAEALKVPGNSGGVAGCPSPKVYIAGSRMCSKAGARICSTSDIQHGAATSTLTACGDKSVWSSSKCGVGPSNFLIHYANGQPGARISNASRAFAGGVANCDQSSSKHQIVCCADSKVSKSQ